MAREISIVFNQTIESTLFAIEALRQNKVRTFLSTLGITIGIFCIIAVLTIVDSLERNVQGSVESLGKDVIFIDKWPWTFTEDYKWWKYMNRPNPKLDELETVAEKSVFAGASTMSIQMGGATIKYENNSAEGVSVNGVTADFDQVRSFDLYEGRFFTGAEAQNGTPVAVIGYAIAQNLFGSRMAIDRFITVKGRKFKVVGVVAKEGESLLGNSLDNTLLVPARTVANYVRINSDRANAQIQVKAAPGVPLQQLEEELRGIMRAERKLKPGEDENFALNKTTLIAEPLKAVFSVITFAGWIIGGFAMLVGGFGIANIMFVSVKERTNQIGIQKSLGAKNYFILIEFLVESIVLCLAGGGIGIALVGIITYFISSAIDFNMMLTANNVITGIVVSVVIGVISGFIPAYNASKLNPVDAIRSK